MSDEQHTIGSGFGARSTTKDVLHGGDLSDRLAIVTGGYSGPGLATTPSYPRKHPGGGLTMILGPPVHSPTAAP
ncbi:hypothetical protein [Nonomuraea deserti]|uniref:hypothetical protein n=1 Tax=Nonomuraea deserti TaxID=1848322 RepID=UPI001C70ACA1